jgi:hypothetical protein
MNEPITINDMQSFAESLVEPRMSSDIGNVIELGTDGGSLGDDLGFGLLTNSKVMNTGSSSSSSESRSININSSSSSSGPDITIGPLENLESTSFDIPMASSGPEITVNRSSSSSSSFSDNTQTATGPGITLSNPLKRLSPEEERKEKADLINKLSRLESKGFTISKRFTMDNSLEEIKMEFERLMDARNLEGSIKFQRQMMMGLVTGMELMNNKFNPFDWQLDGWSESVHENVDDYDEVFEELYDKYKGKGNMPPEARLLFMMVGSGFMFHMSNSFFRSKIGNMSMDDILKNNPGLAKQMAAAAAQAAGPGFGNFMGAAMGVPQGMANPMPPGMQNQQSSAGAFYQPPNQPMNMAQQQVPVKRREMSGPSGAGVEDILNTFKEVREAETNSHPMFSPRPDTMNPAKAALSEIQSLHSDDMQSQSGSVGTARTAGGGRKRKAQLPSGNTMSLNL